MKRTFIMFLSSALMLLAACADYAPRSIEWPPITVLGVEAAQHRNASEKSAQNTERAENAAEPYIVLYESPELKPAMYEPADGCYLSALFDCGAEQVAPLAEFNKKSGKKHAVCAYEMRVGDAFPEIWLLGCIAEQTAPMIILRPSDDKAAFASWEMVALASAFGAYNIPFFIVFFPVERDGAYDTVAYGLYYRYARAIFAEYAPRAAFVWAAAENVSEAFYPGDEAADWVGWCGSLDGFNDFYMGYQRRKPLMLIDIAVSHFNAEDYKYSSKDAAEELEGVYAAVRDNYPRVKLINYTHKNEIDGPSKHDYTLLGDDIMIDAYKRNIGDGRFLSRLKADEKVRSLLLSRYTAYSAGGEIYVKAESLTGEVKLPLPKESKWFGGERYVRLERETAANFLIVDDERKTVKIYLKATSKH